jgi:flagellin
MMAMNAARNLSDIYGRLSKSTQRLSSGLRVNSAADDAAGLAIREQMRADIQVLNQGVRNASDAFSMIQTAEGAMNVIDEKLVRMKELAEQAATGTYTTSQREIMDSEFQAMAAEIDRIANATRFNGVQLLDGTLHRFHEGSGMKVHFGAGNSAAEDYYFIDMGDMRATAATGLRVGNSDPKEVWRTTSLNASSATAKLSDAASSTSGIFGIQFSTTLDTSNTPVWSFYGYVSVDPTHQTVSDLMSEINKGSQATGTIEFGSLTSANLESQAITVGGQVFSFTTADAALSYSGTTGTVGINLGSTTSIALNFAAEMNNNYASTGVFAAVDGTTVHLFAKEFGTDGNQLTTSGSTTGLTFSGNTLAGGGAKVLTADTWFDNSTNEYELQIKMDKGGDSNQMRLFSLTTLGDAGDVISSSATVGYLGSLTTGVSGSYYLTNYPTTNEDTEWNEAQNGSGNTSWDGRDIRTQSGAQLALAALDTAINRKDVRRAELGAFSNRLENTITNLQIQAENLQAAESRISDVDVALEMTEFTKNNILAQAATAMLAQANSLPQLALKLLGRPTSTSPRPTRRGLIFCPCRRRRKRRPLHVPHGHFGSGQGWFGVRGCPTRFGSRGTRPRPLYVPHGHYGSGQGWFGVRGYPTRFGSRGTRPRPYIKKYCS